MDKEGDYKSIKKYICIAWNRLFYHNATDLSTHTHTHTHTHANKYIYREKKRVRRRETVKECLDKYVNVWKDYKCLYMW